MSLLSMTGYGEASGELVDGSSVRVIVKSVNQRFLDVSLKAPSSLSLREQELVQLVKKKISRGRVDLHIFVERTKGNASCTIDQGLLLDALSKVQSIKLPDVSETDFKTSLIDSLLSRKEVLEISTTGEDFSSEDIASIASIVEVALSSLIDSRKREGKELEKEVRSQIKKLDKNLSQIDSLSSHVASELMDKLRKRVAELLDDTEVTEERLLQEVAIAADKADVREEIVRLASHISHFLKIINEGGRKLEFLLQEMNREVNTIGSKSPNIEVSKIVVESKSCLEKLREQIQNIE